MKLSKTDQQPLFTCVSNNIFAYTLKPLALVLSMVMLSACSSNPKSQKPSTSSVYQPADESLKASDDNDDLEELLSATDMQAVESNRVDVLRYGDMWKRMRAGFGLDLSIENGRIDAQKNWFTARQPYIERLSARASRYIYYTVAEAERRGIPTELALLPVIESSYDPTATSNAAAAGMWQFIPSTGRIYGLRQTPTYDGRRDVIESTRAAYDFLTSLYNKFGSWELALAAYNCGPGCVNKAITRNERQGRSTDYWSLRLPKETMNYVPRFLAVAKIVQDPSRYGVYLPSISNRPHFRSVPIQGGVSLNSVSNITGLDLETLYDLNPALSQGVTDIEGPNRLLVPTSLSYKYDSKISELKGYGYSGGYSVADSLPVQTLDSSEAAQVMSAELPTTSGAATSVKSAPESSGSDNITATGNQADFYKKQYKNKSKSLPNSPTGLAEFAANARVPNQNVSYIQPKRSGSQNTAVANQTNTQPERVNTTDPEVVVKTPKVLPKPVNETEKQQLQTKVLADINSLPTSAAQVTKNETVVQYPALTKKERAEIAAEIKKADPTAKVIDPLDGEIKLEAIQTQQSILAAQGKAKKLTFKAPEKKPTKISKKIEKPKGKRTVYKVRSGDSLKKIGERFGLGWRDIAKWNQINPNASLYVGTPLYLYGAKAVKPAPKPTSYRVQAGDTMIGVANKFNMSASQLAKLNGMKALDNLIVGQRLALVEDTRANSSQSSTSSSRRTSRQQTQTYRVKSGEGLIQLAKRFGMSTSELAKLNGISPRKSLYVGQRLKVPARVVTRPKTYMVQSGDTVTWVAAKFDVSATELASLNGLSILDDLLIGQKLKLPGGAPSKYLKTSAKQTVRKKRTKKASRKKEPVKKEKPTSYVVESGDTMIYVARKFGIATNKLAKWNGMKSSDNLMIGQRLTLVDDRKLKSKSSKRKREDSKKVSAKKSEKTSTKKKASKKNSTSYVVESGDTMIYVARKFGISTNNLAKWNGMKPMDALRIGQTLTLVNNGKGSKASKTPRSSKKLSSKDKTRKNSKKEAAKKKSSKKTSKYTSYTVKSGDGLIALARKHGVSTAKLAKINKMKPTDALQLGKTIKVPAK